MKRRSLSIQPMDDIGKKKNPNNVSGGKRGWKNRSQADRDRTIKRLSEWHQSRREKNQILKEMNERVGLETDEYIY